MDGGQPRRHPRDRARTAEAAERFDAIIRSLTEARRATGEIVCILRNWAGGDLGSMALCTGVVLTYLADRQDRVRGGVSDRELDAILDEILRIDDPFVAKGAGKHVCPGRPLGSLELRALTRAVLAATEVIEADPGRPRQRGLPPVGGFSAAPLRLA